jgi:4-hydroxy-4-methyl-2-oxoglutarate aldolase
MNVIVRDFPRADRALVEALVLLGVSTVHEADRRRGALATAVRPIQDGARVAGTAVTVCCPPGDNLMIHAAIETCRPGDVIVVATTSPCTDGMVGELLATSMRAHGVVGLVTDAGVRDVAELRAMGFPVWARAVSPQGTVKASAGSVNVPVVCAGQLFNPGDVVVADDDGVVVVPRDRAAAVLAAGQQRQANEDEKRTRLSAGELSVDMYALRAVLEGLGVTYIDGPPE